MFVSIKGAFITFAVTIGLTVAASAAEIEVKPPQSPGSPAMIFLQGPIESGDGEKFEASVRSVDRAVVFFRSPGGNLRAGLSIGATINTKGFATAVPPSYSCASACALAWLGGARRYMEPNSKIGFHAASIERNGRAQESGLANALIGAYLNQLGLPLIAVEYITFKSPDDIQWLSITDAMRIGINVSVASNLPSARRNNDEEDSLEETKKEIDRAVANMTAQYKKTGMAGLRGSVEACYARFASSTTIKFARYCFALDHAAMRLDQEMSKLFNMPQNPYFLDARVITRANWAFDKLEYEQAKRGGLLSIWSRLSERAFVAANQ
jgi:hypothetical protein